MRTLQISADLSNLDLRISTIDIANTPKAMAQAWLMFDAGGDLFRYWMTDRGAVGHADPSVDWFSESGEAVRVCDRRRALVAA